MAPEELKVTPPPPEVEYLWQIYGEIAAARPSTGFGPGAIPWAEIAAWSALSGRPLSRWEAQTLRAIDRAILRVMNEQQQRITRTN